MTRREIHHVRHPGILVRMSQGNGFIQIAACHKTRARIKDV